MQTNGTIQSGVPLGTNPERNKDISDKDRLKSSAQNIGKIKVIRKVIKPAMP